MGVLSRLAMTLLLWSLAVARAVPLFPFAPGPGGGADPYSFTGTALNSWSAHLLWSVPVEAARLEILRDDRLIDRFAARETGSYTDYLLWQLTTYHYELKAFDSAERVVLDLSAPVITPAQVGSFPRSYADNSFWNTPISRNPTVDRNSQAMVAASFLPWRQVTVIDNDNAWGIPIAYADANSKVYRIKCLKYLCDQRVKFRIPGYARPNTGQDGHLAVYDPATNRELDMWQGSYDESTDRWSASTRTDTVADWGAVCPEGQHCGGGGVAAGFLEWGGTIRPEEIAQGHIDHALVITSPYLRYNYISCPAVDIWASQSPNYARDHNAIPLGARVQLSPSVDVGQQPWPEWEKVVARALQTYGAYVVDVGEVVALRGEANLLRGYDAWSLVGMTNVPHPHLSNLPWNEFRVLKLRRC